MSEIRRVVIHQSLVRPLLLGGAERDLVLVNGSIAAGLIFGAGSWQAALLGVAFAIGGHAIMVWMAKKDTRGFAVYKRHIEYQSYYPAQALHTAPPPIVRYYKV